MNEHFEPVNKMYCPKFTYHKLQKKAVAEGALKEYKENGGTTKDWKYDLDHGFIQFKSVNVNARKEDESEESDEVEVEPTLEEKYEALLKENASQKKRIEKLIDTAIAFITVEDTRAYLEDEGDLTYDDDDIYNAIVKVCGEGYDQERVLRRCARPLARDRGAEILTQHSCVLPGKFGGGVLGLAALLIYFAVKPPSTMIVWPVM